MEFSSKNAIIPVCLNGKNYSLWEFNFRCFVQGHELWGYVDDSETKSKTVKDDKDTENKTKLKKMN